MNLRTALLILLAFHAGYGQSTSFTYQGRLTDAGSPASGTYDLSFRLFNALSGGTQIGPDQEKDNVAVSGGIFTVVLDFGSSPFTSSGASYLEISVRPGASTGSFTLLAPRQPITSSPYAVQTIRAESAAVADNANALGGIPAASFVQTSDPRLSDARSPTAGSANYIQNSTGVQPLSNFNISGDGTAGGTLTGNVVNATTQFNLGGAAVLRASSDPSYNVFGGLGTGQANTTGIYNSMFGAEAGTSNTTGTFNSFFGSSAGYSNTTGMRNAYFGISAGSYVTAGNDNAFFGAFSGGGTVNQGSANSFFGYLTGAGNSTGQENSFVGYRSGSSNVTGSQNTALGANANVMSSALVNATAIGHRAAVSQSNSLVLGSINGINAASATVNVGIGTTAPAHRLHVVGNGFFDGNLSVTGTLTAPLTGSYIQNTTTQQASSNFNVSGDGRVGGNFSAGVLIAGRISVSEYFIGEDRAVAAPCFHCTAVGANTGAPTGALNSFFGRGSGVNTTTGGSNSFFGSGNPIGSPQTGTGLKNTSGSFNSFFGHRAGENNTIGSVNSFFGTGAGIANVDGGSNTFIGHDAGNTNVNGSANTIVGENADVGSGGLSNASAFGSRAFVTNSNSIVLGAIAGANGSPNDTNVGIGITAPQFRFHVVDSGNGGVRIETNTAGGRVASFGPRGDFFVDRAGSSPVAISGGRFSILENGAVGVGIGSPNFKFHIRSDGQDGIKIQHTGTGAFPQIRWTDLADDFKASIGVDTGGTGSMNFFVNGADRLVLQPNGVVRSPGGIYIANPNTLVITSPNGSCWGITVSDTGALAAFSTPCP